jgi:hypothetical protein
MFASSCGQPVLAGRNRADFGTQGQIEAHIRLSTARRSGCDRYPLPACSLRRCSWPRRRTPSPSAFGTATLSFLSSTITVPTLGDRERQTFLRPFDFTGSVTLSGAGEVLDLTGNGTVRFDLIGQMRRLTRTGLSTPSSRPTPSLNLPRCCCSERALRASAVRAARCARHNPDRSARDARVAEAIRDADDIYHFLHAVDADDMRSQKHTGRHSCRGSPLALIRLTLAQRGFQERFA